MADTDVKTRKNEHSSEEDWFDFARQQAAPALRARLEQHLEKGCSRCTQTVRLWRAVLDVADQEAAYRPPDEALRQLKGDFALRRPKGLLERVAEQAALVFDSFRQPQPAGVRTAGAAPRQLLYKAGRYSIRLRLEPASDAERLSIVGQLVDEQHSPAAVQDIAVIALKGTKTVDRTLTNHLGEFVLEPDSAENLRLCVGVAEIGTFTVVPRQATGRTEGDAVRALDMSGRRGRARQR
ncbi:MAG TPA: hypothetical protein VFS78_09390 [Vicinamibacteria bacterium]|nr:hypothetical protein [Vicinamibacteria bacterium]